MTVHTFLLSWGITTPFSPRAAATTPDAGTRAVVGSARPPGALLDLLHSWGVGCVISFAL